MNDNTGFFEITPVMLAFPGFGSSSDQYCNVQIPGQLLLPVGVTEQSCWGKRASLCPSLVPTQEAIIMSDPTFYVTLDQTVEDIIRFCFALCSSSLLSAKKMLWVTCWTTKQQYTALIQNLEQMSIFLLTLWGAGWIKDYVTCCTQVIACLLLFEICCTLHSSLRSKQCHKVFPVKTQDIPGWKCKFLFCRKCHTIKILKPQKKQS